MRIALFGGSFDPPHNGHVAVAKAAADRFRLDKVLFAPAGRQPLKLRGAGASYAERFAMTELACGVDERFEVTSIDGPRQDGSPNFTYLTLMKLKTLYPDAERFNLVGADSFHTLSQWKRPKTLVRLAKWIVVSRPGYELAEPPGMTLNDAERSRIHLLDSIHEDVTATDLRERLHAGDACADLLPAAVSGYIRQHHLYLPS